MDKKNGNLWIGEGRSRGLSPLGLWRGTEDAEKSGTERLPFWVVEPVQKGRIEGEGFLASAGAWGLIS